jgi:hypothetical protein
VDESVPGAVATCASAAANGFPQPHGLLITAARISATDRAFWFLGPATYVEHRGEKPIAITWRLEHPLPGDLFAQFAAAVA